MKRKTAKTIAIFLVFCIAFSGLPFLTCSLDVYAAATAKKITLKVSSVGQTTVSLSWNRIKSPGKGYAVFRDGRVIKRLGTKKTSFKDSGLEPGSAHKYQIKTYSTGKVTKWFNKQTGKWQIKRPAKKYRGRRKKFTVYKYKKKSKTISIQTEPSGEASDPSADTADPSISAPANFKCVLKEDGTVLLTWDKVDGATGYRIRRDNGHGERLFKDVVSTSSTDSSVKSGSIYQYYVTALKDGKESQRSIINTISINLPDEKKTVTDYTGKTTEIYKKPDEEVWRYASNDVQVSSMAQIDKTVDGEFDVYSNHMIQYHGATFNATAISNAKPDNYDYTVEMYNGDPDKFSLELENGVSIGSRDTYKEVGNHKYEAAKKYYYYKNGHPIAMPHTSDGVFNYKTETSGNITTKHFLVINAAMCVGDAVGIWTDTFKVYVKYDGKTIGTITVDTARDEYLGPDWTSQTAGGMSPWRRVALNIADQAIASKGGSTGYLYRDLRLIGDYIEENYVYGEEVPVYGTYMNMKCVAGAIVLETYSVYHFGKYGFESSGSNYSSGTHSAFNLDEDPQTYYEASGRLQ